MIYLYITLIVIVGFLILYKVIKSHMTTYEFSTVFVLKNELPPSHLGSVHTPFNLLGDISGLNADKITIQRKTKLVWGKPVSTEFKIVSEYEYQDDDDCW